MDRMKATTQKLQFAGVLASALILSACGGGGNVSAYNADRGNQVYNSDTSSEVRVLARATDFDRDQRISTRGRAEVIYISASTSGSSRGDRDSRVDDARARAREVTGCQQAIHTHSQESIRGTHVMLSLSSCPQLSQR